MVLDKYDVRRLADLDVIVTGNVTLAQETEQVKLNPATLREGVLALLEDRAPGRYWVAEEGGQVVGQLLITYEWSDWRNRMVWWIQSVHVAPEARRHGVFRALYAFVRQEAQGLGRRRPASIRAQL